MDFSKHIIRFETQGCRLNQIESEGAAHFFIQNGFTSDMTPVSAKSLEDSSTVLVIVNTCSVTQKAEQKARRIIRLLLKKYPMAVILVTGCYAQLRPEEIKKMDLRISVLGGQLKSRLSEVPSVLKESLENSCDFDPVSFVEILEKKIISRPVEKEGVPEKSFTLSTDSFLAHSRSSLKIQDGCNSRCSYCTINFARGKSVSLPAEEVIARVRQLEKAGQTEVVITTVNIAQYHSEYNGKIINFSGLLKLILENTEKINVRISSIYPQIVNDDFCEAVKNPRVCPHFHISVQSGSDKILSSMNRGYTAASVVEACRKIREVKENPFLACDIITGFPGETDEDFEETLELCRRCGFAWIHAFPYSERPGTEAVKLPNKVPQAVSGERASRLTRWASESKIAYVSSFIGKELDCVIETVRKPKVFAENKVIYHAVTSNFLHCEIECDETLNRFSSGTPARVRIESVLSENVMKGGETECRASIVQNQ